jgi:membrane-associated protein
LLDFVLDPARHLTQWSNELGTGFYVVLFLIIFAETGLVVVPFLPGDSVLVAVGTIAATRGSQVDPWLAGLVLCAAAITGDSTNYWIGRWLGPRVFRSDSSRLLNRKHLAKAQAFYERHGAKTVILCRFLAIIRTFAPFVAGVGAMRYPKFLTYSVIGTVLWIGTFLPLGYWLARSHPGAERWVIWGIVAFAVVPPSISYLRDRAARKRDGAARKQDAAAAPADRG